MDLCAILVKATTHTPFLLHSSHHLNQDHNNYYNHSVSFQFSKFRDSSQSNGDVLFDMRASKRRFNRGFIVTALGKDNSCDPNSNSNSSENDDHKTPKEDHSKGKDPPSKRNKHNEPGSQQHHNRIMDWREFRAYLFANEQLRTYRGHTNEKNFVGLSVNSEYLACGSETNDVFAYHKDISKPAAWHRFGADSEEAEDDPGSYFISAVCWKSDSPTMLTANSRGTIKVLVLAA